MTFGLKSPAASLLRLREVLHGFSFLFAWRQEETQELEALGISLRHFVTWGLLQAQE